MKAGAIVKTFSAKDGRKVVLRALRWEDLDDLLEMINSLVEEKANIIRDQKVSREEEIEWLSRALVRQEKEEVIYIVAQVDGKAVANSEINRKQSGYEKHVGAIGIAIKEGFRDLGIGTEMMKALIEQGKKMGLKVLTLAAFANNARAIHVYKKIGFVETGRIPRKFFKDNKYIDETIMTLELE
jgi:RimJ/RimL family protein N-acetyltransferase